jgi:hypothetical protein
MPTFRDGQVNLLGLTNPGVYRRPDPADRVHRRRPDQHRGGRRRRLVGTGECRDLFQRPGLVPLRPPQARTYDIAKHAAVAFQLGSAVRFAAFGSVTVPTLPRRQPISTGSGGSLATGVTLTARTPASSAIRSGW